MTLTLPHMARQTLGTAALSLGCLAAASAAAQKVAQKKTTDKPVGAGDETKEVAKEVAREVAKGVAKEGDAVPARCAIEVELVAVVLDDKKEERSFAMVARKGQKPRMVGVGSWVGDRAVRAIDPRAIWLSDPEGLCWLPLERGTPAARPAGATPARATTPPPGSSAAERRERRKQREDRRKQRAAERNR